MAFSSFTTEEDFIAAFDQYADAIFRHCFLRTHSRAQAKELTEQTFTTLWDFIAAGNYVDSLQLMLYRFSHELIAKSKEVAAKDMDADLKPLESVAAPDRPAVILHYVDGFSSQEIQRIIGGSSEQHELAVSRSRSVFA